MDLFEETFGSEFEPHLDENAAIKFILNSLMMDKTLDRLIEIFDLSLNIGCIEGEPGWELERIEDKDRKLSGYSEWPDWAMYRVAVEPESYQLKYPEIYYRSDEFMAFVEKSLKVFSNKYPEKRDALKKPGDLVV